MKLRHLSAAVFGLLFVSALASADINVGDKPTLKFKDFSTKKSIDLAGQQRRNHVALHGDRHRRDRASAARASRAGAHERHDSSRARRTRHRCRRAVSYAAPGEHAGRYLGAWRDLEQHKLH